MAEVVAGDGLRPGSFAYFKKTRILVAMVFVQIPLVLMALAIFIVAFTFASGTFADHVDSFCKSSVDAQESSLRSAELLAKRMVEEEPDQSRVDDCKSAFATLLTVMRNVAIAGSVVAFVVNGGGMAAALKANKPGLGVYIAGTIIAIITLIVCVILPAVSSVLFGVLCAAAEPCYRCQDAMSQSSCAAAAYGSTANCAVYSNDYNAFCVDLKGKLDAVTSIFVIEVVGTFVLSVLTCVIIGRIGKNFGQTTVVVMQTVPPQQQPYVVQGQQPVYPAPPFAPAGGYPNQYSPQPYPGQYPAQPYPAQYAYGGAPAAFYPVVDASAPGPQADFATGGTANVTL